LAPKWNDYQFKTFIKILEETGNKRATEIFTADGAEVFLTRDQIEMLKIQMNRLGLHSGYEGIIREDEKIAETIQGYLKDGKLFDVDKFQLDPTLKERRREIVPMIQKFVKAVKDKTVWINPDKLQLPNNYIDRRICTRMEVHKLSLIDVVLLNRLIKLVLLSDAPGMGKSSALLNLNKT